MRKPPRQTPASPRTPVQPSQRLADSGPTDGMKERAERIGHVPDFQCGVDRENVTNYT